MAKNSTQIEALKQVEKMPLNDEERYRGVFEAAMDGIAICDTSGVFLDVNRAYCEIVGYSYEELLTMNAEAVIHPEYRHQLLGLFIPQILKDGRIRIDALGNRKDGTAVPVEIYGVTFSHNGKIAILIIVRDHSERKNAELRMAHINKVLYTIRNINHLILTENNRDRLIQNACRVFLSQKGYYGAWIVLLDQNQNYVGAAQAGLNERFDLILPELRKEKFPPCCRGVLYQDRVTLTKELEKECSNCPLKCYLSKQTSLAVRLEHERILLGILVLAVSDRHVTEPEEQLLLANVAGDLAFGLHNIQLEMRRKQAEQELVESEERARILADKVADGVILVHNSKLTFANEAFASMFGYQRVGDIIGEGLEVLRSAELQKYFTISHEATMSKDSIKAVFEAKCIARDGRNFWVEARHNVITWEGEYAILATLRDVTESKFKQIAIEEDKSRLLRENKELRSTMRDRYRFGDIVGKSDAMQKIYNLIITASSSDANVIIYGESGTGKELIARTIHERSHRKNEAFVPVNCGAIPDALFESEFFGYRKGAFTGAYCDKSGFFDLAHGGTLFLDEVGELSPEHQVKLLRAIDGGGYTPVGDNKVKKVDVRIAAATNRDLSDMIQKGLMREDFFYRIHIIPIAVPPLRNRREDILLLIDHFLNIYGGERKSTSIPGKIFEALYNHEWPGNVREIQNVIHRYVALGHLDFAGSHGVPSNSDLADEIDGENSGLRVAMEIFEKKHIRRVLEETRWQKGKASEKLRIPRRTLYSKLKKHGLL